MNDVFLLLQKASHDVSQEPRDKYGKWAKVGESASTPAPTESEARAAYLERVQNDPQPGDVAFETQSGSNLYGEEIHVVKVEKEDGQPQIVQVSIATWPEGHTQPLSFGTWKNAFKQGWFREKWKNEAPPNPLFTDWQDWQKQSNAEGIKALKTYAYTKSHMDEYMSEMTNRHAFVILKTRPPKGFVFKLKTPSPYFPDAQVGQEWVVSRTPAKAAEDAKIVVNPGTTPHPSGADAHILSGLNWLNLVRSGALADIHEDTATTKRILDLMPDKCAGCHKSFTGSKLKKCPYCDKEFCDNCFDKHEKSCPKKEHCAECGKPAKSDDLNTCSLCKQKFCVQHIGLNKHNCPAAATCPNCHKKVDPKTLAADPLTGEKVCADCLTKKYGIEDFNGDGKISVEEVITDPDVRTAAKDHIVRDLAARLADNAAFREYAANISYRTGGLYGDNDQKNLVNYLVHSWASTACDTSPIAIALQKAAIEEFNLEGSEPTWEQHGIDGLDAAKQADGILHEHGQALHAFLRAMYDSTQEYFQKKGIKKISLYRGFSYDKKSHKGLATEENLDLSTITKVMARLQPMSSFSTSMRIARGFYGERGVPVVVKVDNIPTANIIGTALTGFGCLNEKEMVVLGQQLYPCIVGETDLWYGSHENAGKFDKLWLDALASRLEEKDKDNQDEYFHDLTEKSVTSTVAPILSLDSDVANADWTKGTWDLPPYGTKEFHQFLRFADMSLAHFKSLPAYRKGILQPKQSALSKSLLLLKASHDVSQEARDARGRWTKVGSSADAAEDPFKVYQERLTHNERVQHHPQVGDVVFGTKPGSDSYGDTFTVTKVNRDVVQISSPTFPVGQNRQYTHSVWSQLLSDGYFYPKWKESDEVPPMTENWWQDLRIMTSNGSLQDFKDVIAGGGPLMEMDRWKAFGILQGRPPRGYTFRLNAVSRYFPQAKKGEDWVVSGSPPKSGPDSRITLARGTKVPASRKGSIILSGKDWSNLVRSGALAGVRRDDETVQKIWNLIPPPTDAEAINKIVSNPGTRSKAKDAIVRALAEKLKDNPDFLDYAKDMEGKTGMVYDEDPLKNAISFLVASWAHTSADSNPMAIALQKAAALEFGLKDYEKPWSDFIDKSAERHLRANVSVYRAFLRAMYDNTQDYFKQKHISKVTLYRGFSFMDKGLEAPGYAPKSKELARGLFFTTQDERIKAMAILQPMSSFSTSLRVAKGFSGDNGVKVVIRTEKVPVKDIIGTALTGFGCLNEKEMVVLGRKKLPCTVGVTQAWTNDAVKDNKRTNLLWLDAAKLPQQPNADDSTMEKSELPTIAVDHDTENADWTKQTWDLPPQDSAQFAALLKLSETSLDHFRTLPAYRFTQGQQKSEQVGTLLLLKAAHDVSQEPRDRTGKWTRVGEAGTLREGERVLAHGPNGDTVGEFQVRMANGKMAYIAHPDDVRGQAQWWPKKYLSKKKIATNTFAKEDQPVFDNHGEEIHAGDWVMAFRPNGSIYGSFKVARVNPKQAYIVIPNSHTRAKILPWPLHSVRKVSSATPQQAPQPDMVTPGRKMASPANTKPHEFRIGELVWFKRSSRDVIGIVKQAAPGDNIVRVAINGSGDSLACDISKLHPMKPVPTTDALPLRIGRHVVHPVNGHDLELRELDDNPAWGLFAESNGEGIFDPNLDWVNMPLAAVGIHVDTPSELAAKEQRRIDRERERQAQEKAEKERLHQEELARVAQYDKMHDQYNSSLGAEYESALETGDFVDDDLMSVGGGHVNVVYRGTLTYQDEAGKETLPVIVKPSSQSATEAFRYGIHPGFDAEREQAAFLINKALGNIIAMPEITIRETPEGRGSVQRFMDGPVPYKAYRGSLPSETDKEWHNMAFYDCVVANLDRHAGNVLVEKNPGPDTGGRHLIGIDHGLILPNPRGPRYNDIREMDGNFLSLEEINYTDMGLLPKEKTALQDFLAHKQEITRQLLSYVPAPAIQDMWGRAQWMLDKNRLLTSNDLSRRVWRRKKQ